MGGNIPLLCGRTQQRPLGRLLARERNMLMALMGCSIMEGERMAHDITPWRSSCRRTYTCIRVALGIGVRSSGEWQNCRPSHKFVGEPPWPAACLTARSLAV